MTNLEVQDLERPMLVFQYRNWRDEVAERRVIPQRVWWGTTEWHPHGCWLLTAYDLDRTAMRDFDIRGINAPELFGKVGFQGRVHDWMLACFGEAIAADGVERNHRFLEEALELVQSKGCTASEAHQLVDYVFGRAVGEVNQEAGGVLVTLAALLTPAGVDMVEAGETELARIWTKVDQIREKQAAKPKHSPLPA